MSDDPRRDRPGRPRRSLPDPPRPACPARRWPGSGSSPAASASRASRPRRRRPGSAWRRSGLAVVGGQMPAGDRPPLSARAGRVALFRLYDRRTRTPSPPATGVPLGPGRRSARLPFPRGERGGDRGPGPRGVRPIGPRARRAMTARVQIALTATPLAAYFYVARRCFHSGRQPEAGRRARSTSACWRSGSGGLVAFGPFGRSVLDRLVGRRRAARPGRSGWRWSWLWSLVLAGSASLRLTIYHVDAEDLDRAVREALGEIGGGFDPTLDGFEDAGAGRDHGQGPADAPPGGRGLRPGARAPDRRTRPRL